jgi:peptidoglycan hydrolase CwlO-like protein
MTSFNNFDNVVKFIDSFGVPAKVLKEKISKEEKEITSESKEKIDMFSTNDEDIKELQNKIDSLNKEQTDNDFLNDLGC